MKSLNLGDKVYVLNEYVDLEEYIVVEKIIKESIYTEYVKEYSYIASKHPIKIQFSDKGHVFMTTSGTHVFSSVDDLIEHINAQRSDKNS